MSLLEMMLEDQRIAGAGGGAGPLALAAVLGVVVHVWRLVRAPRAGPKKLRWRWPRSAWRASESPKTSPPRQRTRSKPRNRPTRMTKPRPTKAFGLQALLDSVFTDEELRTRSRNLLTVSKTYRLPTWPRCPSASPGMLA